MKFAVIGDPVAQSKSPRIHNAWMKALGIHGQYEAVRIPAGAFESGLKSLEKSGFRGLNVTMPHKLDAARVAIWRSELVQNLGAANTLVRTDDGWRAHNTDVDGFAGMAAQQIPPGLAAGDGSILLIGAGGAAAAVAYWAAGTNRPVTVVNRTFEKAEALVARFLPETGKAEPLERMGEFMGRASIVVNMIALGEAAGGFHFPEGEGRVFFDISYGEKVRPIITRARERGWKAQDGLQMLVEQAASAFEIWHGVRPDARAMFAELSVEAEKARAE